MNQPPYNAQDVSVNHGVQIQVRPDGRIIWINVDGICTLRLILADNATIEVEDKREPK